MQTDPAKVAASLTKRAEDRDALQRAWDGIESLPPIIFSNVEAALIVSALRAHILKGQSDNGR